MLSDSPNFFLHHVSLAPGVIAGAQIDACKEYAAHVHISQLEARRKRALWAGIQLADPALAELMANDAFVAELKQQLGAEQVMDQKQFNVFLKQTEVTHE